VTEDEARRLLAEVLAGIAPEAELSAVAEEEDLREALDLDSIDFQNLVIGLHERTGLPIPETDYPRLATLRGMLAYLAAGGG
jgi:acyl carrier protein